MGRGQIDHGSLVIFGFLCGVVGRARGEKREKTLRHNGIDGGEAIGVDIHRAATAAYRKISPDLSNFMI